MEKNPETNSNNDSIELPISQKAFLHLQNARKFGMDIGGSLVKIAYSSSFDCKTASLYEDESDLIYSMASSSKKVPTLNFIKFETKYIEAALDFMVKNITLSKEFNEGKSIKATGGGATKYKDLISQKLGVNVEKEDELKCLIKGCNFLMCNVPNEVFTIDYTNSKYEFQVIEKEKLFPYLLVNIGSGVSILKVDSEESFQRVGGSTIGGGTLWGLGSLLTDAKGFDEILELAEKGDHKNIDMLVKDIYGGGYDALGLDNDLIASSLGKTTRSRLDNNCTREEHLKKFKQEDLVKSILIAICYDLSQLASLHAKINNVKKVIFGGYFISKNLLTMRFLKHGISYWSQNQIDCLFLRHEGYLGAVGAFLKSTEESDDIKYSWFENYAHSSVFASVRPKKQSTSFDCFELNREEKKLVAFPFLFESANYIPDLVDLTQDEEARQYWLDCFQKTINTYENQCVKTNPNDPNIKIRAHDFKISYLNKLKELKKSPFAYGMLTVRSLLDLREHCMCEWDFYDVYLNEKREENKLGLDLLKERCELIDSIEDASQKWYELFRGLIAGNVYDYGAQAFIKKQEQGQLSQFIQALNTVEDNLQSREDFKILLKKLEANEYKKICIFVDNSGFDVILGVLPLVIDFLKSPNTKVILCANSKPAINDITHSELIFLIKKACFLNETLKEAYNVTKNLILIETGSASPCLDFSRVNVDLADLVVKENIDFIIIEGMGRAIHTNFKAKFKCDCLKVAVLKNQWLAEKFGFIENDDKKFPVIFKFEKAANV